MGVKNFLIEGVSGTGKTTVCHELRRRSYQAIKVSERGLLWLEENNLSIPS